MELPDYKELQKPIYDKAKNNNLKGTILLAKEGINGTISGTESGINNMIEYLKSDRRLYDLEYKKSFDKKDPFNRLKIKLKKEIVPIGIESVDPTSKVGEYVDPSAWNDLLNDPDVLLIDTRNDYEYFVGSFKNAVNPNIRYFRDFPDYVEKNLNSEKHKKVAMFCTGGIRCEKASSYMLSKGFEQVFHLKGGILKYLEEVPEDKSLWEGECFVFDDRASVDHNLNNGTYELCRNCRSPLSIEDRKSDKYEDGISCSNCYDSLTADRISSLKERKKQMELAKSRNDIHLGAYIHKRKLDN